MFATILLVFALVLFIIAGLVPNPDPWPWRLRLMCFGLACWVGASVLGPLLK